MPAIGRRLREFEVYGPKTQCICPRCGRYHNMRMMWSGHGIPRKFCPSCKQVIERHPELDHDDVDYTVNLRPRHSRAIMSPIERGVVSEMAIIPTYR